MAVVLIHIFGHHSRSIYDHNEVWISTSDRSEFSLRSNMVIRFRVYAVTGKNKLVSSPLVLLAFIQAIWGVILLVYFLRQAGGCFDTCSFTLVDGHPELQLPEEILDLFRVCIFQLWKSWTVAYFSTALAFGVFSPSDLDFWSSKMPRVLHHPTS